MHCVWILFPKRSSVWPLHSVPDSRPPPAKSEVLLDIALFIDSYLTLYAFRVQFDCPVLAS